MGHVVSTAAQPPQSPVWPQGLRVVSTAASRQTEHSSLRHSSPVVVGSLGAAGGLIGAGGGGSGLGGAASLGTGGGASLGGAASLGMGDGASRGRFAGR